MSNVFATTLEAVRTASVAIPFCDGYQGSGDIVERAICYKSVTAALSSSRGRVLDAVRHQEAVPAKRHGKQPAPAPHSERAAKLKRVEQPLETATEWFHALMMNAADAVALLDDKGTILYQSPSVERILGQSPEQLEGKSFSDLTHPDDMQQVVSLLQIRTGEPRQDLHVPATCPAQGWLMAHD